MLFVMLFFTCRYSSVGCAEIRLKWRPHGRTHLLHDVPHQSGMFVNPKLVLEQSPGSGFLILAWLVFWLLLEFGFVFVDCRIRPCLSHCSRCDPI